MTNSFPSPISHTFRVITYALVALSLAPFGPGAIPFVRAADAPSPIPETAPPAAPPPEAPPATAPPPEAPVPPSGSPAVVSPAPLVPVAEVEKHLALYLDARTGAEMTPALETLRKDGSPAVTTLLDRLRTELAQPEPNTDMVGRIEHALVKIGQTALLPVVALLRSSAEGAPLRAESARVLSRIQGYRSVLALVEVAVEAMEDDTPSLAARIIEVLGEIGDPRPFPTLERALEHNSPLVRFAAAAAMGKLADPSAYPPLMKALEDPDVAVRAAAQRSLLKLSGATLEFSPDGSPEARADGILQWRSWYLRNRDALKPPPDPATMDLWRHANDLMEWAILGRPLPGSTKNTPFPGAPSPEENVLLSTENMPTGVTPLLEGRRLVLKKPGELGAPPKEGYWRFQPARTSETKGALTLEHALPGQRVDAATVEYTLKPEGWTLTAVTPLPPVTPIAPPKASPSLPAPTPSSESPASPKEGAPVAPPKETPSSGEKPDGDSQAAPKESNSPPAVRAKP